MQNYSNNNILRGILMVLLLSGCGTKVKVPDVSHIPIHVTIERFDKQLFRIDTNNVPGGIKLLDSTYPDFMPVYIKEIMNFGPLADTNLLLEPQVRQFLTNKDFRGLQDSVEAHFADIKPLEKDLTQAFRLTKYYLPAFHAPRVISFISAIGNYAAFTVDSILAIGLDMHMGADFPIYRMLPDYPDYVIRKFTPENITTNAMKVLQQNYYPLRDENVKLIERFIDLGKQQYFLEKVLPEVPENIRLGYTKEQLKYCNENEQMIWQHFVQNKLLYSSDWQDVVRYTAEGPSTQGLPGEVPGQIGAFTGYRIVKKFMEKHPDVTLEKLLGTKDVMQIFNEAKYRP
jgi:hypothetical protein